MIITRWDVINFDDYIENKEAGYWCKYHEVAALESNFKIYKDHCILVEKENAKLLKEIKELKQTNRPYAEGLKNSCLGNERVETLLHKKRSCTIKTSEVKELEKLLGAN